MILVNTDYISGKELEMLGLVKGSTIRSKHIGKDILQSLKTLVGGELKAYNEMMNEARALATKRMVEEAEELGADAFAVEYLGLETVKQGFVELRKIIETISEDYDGADSALREIDLRLNALTTI